MRKYFTILLLCFLPVSLLAQSGVSTSLFTGRMSYTIPIYTIEDPDFNLDIALCYSSEGFKPFQPSGCYGQDWTLVAGGCITRMVQGEPDEVQCVHDYKTKSDTLFGRYYDYHYPTEWGFARMFQFFDSIGRSYPDKEKVFNIDATVCGKNGVAVPNWEVADDVEYMPDIFYFNFCGHTGRFIVNNKGEVEILSGDFVKIDISKIGWRDNIVRNYRGVDRLEGGVSQITIQTTDGYTYVFGGQPGTWAYSYTTDKNEIINHAKSIVSAWYLAKIEAPNGRVLEFGYVGPQSQRQSSFYTNYDWTIDDKNARVSYALLYDCILKSITLTDSIPLKVLFSYSNESHKMYDDTSNYEMCYPHLQLDSISVSYDYWGGGSRHNRVLREAKLVYEYRSYEDEGVLPNYYWRYLSEVSVSGVGKYKMTYNDIDLNKNHLIPLDPFERENPYPMMTRYRYPSLNTPRKAGYRATVDRFGFWKETPLQGLLSQVDLPTGGHIEFAYDLHDYATERRFQKYKSYYDVIFKIISGSNKTIGGARIARVDTYSDAEKLVERKTYSYDKAGKSTGIFYNIYAIYNEEADEWDTIAHPHNYNMVTSHIGYSYVEQLTTIGSDKSKIAYTFDVGKVEANNGYVSTDSKSIKRNTNVSNYDIKKEYCSGSLTYDGYLIPSGKVIKIESFVGENKLIKSIQYTYNDGATSTRSGGPGNPPIKSNIFGCVDTIVCLSTYSAHVARKLFVCPDVLEKITTQEFDANGQKMETVQEFRYDKKLRKKQIKVTDSRGKQFFTKYTYPDEVPGVVKKSAYYMLSEVNRIGKPVETISGYVEGGKEYITGGLVEHYTTNMPVQAQGLNRAPSNLGSNTEGTFPYVGFDTHDALWQNTDPYPSLGATYSLRLNEPLSISEYKWLNMSGEIIIHDPNYALTSLYHYDKRYRLLSIQPFGKTETKYTYTPKGLYPLTKTIGNQTWKYSFIPYVGVSQIIDPRGIITNYIYDDKNRLIEESQIINGNKQILNAYQYHIKTEEQ